MLVSLIAVSILLTLSLAFLSRADEHADRVKAFQNAINYSQDKQACRSIPYPDLEDSCHRKQEIVERWCKNSGTLKCDGSIDPQKTQKSIEDAKTERDVLKAKKEELERKKSSLKEDKEKRENEDKIKEIDDRLYQLKRTQEELEKEVSAATKTISDRIYAGKACRDARPDVIAVFKDARSRASSEHDADIEPLAKRLIAFWEDSEKGHNQQLDEVKTMIDKCDRILYEVGHLGKY
jgi:chromosome segregation ATPase